MKFIPVEDEKARAVQFCGYCVYSTPNSRMVFDFSTEKLRMLGDDTNELGCCVNPGLLVQTHKDRPRCRFFAVDTTKIPKDTIA